tara:strand:- start:1407 stop:1640 length:234 start_codon:yes stop_codon:yes gene_type:complete
MEDLRRLFWSFIITGELKKVSEDKFNERINICRANTCGSYKKPLGIKTLEKCGSCGCFLNAKARIDEFYIECPKGLW